MKQLFCWFIQKILPSLGYIALGLCCPILTPAGYFMEDKMMAGILELALELIPAYFTAKFAANNYEEYFMDYHDWLASRVSFFETKTGFVIRTFVLGASCYSMVASIITSLIYGSPKV